MEDYDKVVKEVTETEEVLETEDVVVKKRYWGVIISQVLIGLTILGLLGYRIYLSVVEGSLSLLPVGSGNDLLTFLLVSWLVVVLVYIRKRYLGGTLKVAKAFLMVALLISLSFYLLGIFNTYLQSPREDVYTNILGVTDILLVDDSEGVLVIDYGELLHRDKDGEGTLYSRRYKQVLDESVLTSLANDQDLELGIGSKIKVDLRVYRVKTLLSNYYTDEIVDITLLGVE